MVETPRVRYGMRRRDRGERGVAAVEAGLITMFLGPMLASILWFGQHFWEQQNSIRPRVTQSDMVGDYTSCEELLDAVRQSVLVNVDNVSRHTDVHLDDIQAQVIDFVSGQLGVDVRVNISSDASAAVGVNQPGLQSQTDLHLENVRLDAQTC
jgi:hypothetical protein